MFNFFPPSHALSALKELRIISNISPKGVFSLFCTVSMPAVTDIGIKVCLKLHHFLGAQPLPRTHSLNSATVQSHPLVISTFGCALRLCSNPYSLKCYRGITLVFHKLCRIARSLGAHKTIISVSTHYKVTSAASSTGSDQKSKTSSQYCPTMNIYVFVLPTFLSHESDECNCFNCCLQ